MVLPVVMDNPVVMVCPVMPAGQVPTVNLECKENREDLELQAKTVDLDVTDQKVFQADQEAQVKIDSQQSRP